MKRCNLLINKQLPDGKWTNTILPAGWFILVKGEKAIDNMKKYYYKIRKTIYWFRVDGKQTYYKSGDHEWVTARSEYVDEILEGRFPDIWIKMDVNNYYNICK